MTTDITPEHAQALRDGTAPSPWIIVEHGGSRPEVMIETFDGDTLAADVEPDDAPLIAAAPALAELVADMHYEYAVLEDVGDWRQRGEWFDTFEEAADYRDMKCEEAPMCIVRRLVGEPEVVE